MKEKLLIINIIIILILSIVSLFAINITIENSNQKDLQISENQISNISENLVYPNPHKNKQFREIQINNNEITFNNSISTELQTKLKNLASDEKEYILMRFNSNPSKEEITQLKTEGIELIEYVGSNTYYAKISKPFDSIFELNERTLYLKSANISDKYLVRNINEINKDIKVSENIRENKINTWVKDEEGNYLLIVEFHNDVTLDEGEKILKENGFDIYKRLEYLNAVIISISGGKENE